MPTRNVLLPASVQGAGKMTGVHAGATGATQINLASALEIGG